MDNNVQKELDHIVEHIDKKIDNRIDDLEVHDGGWWVHNQPLLVPFILHG